MTSQQIQYGGRPPYWTSSFGYISTNDYPINAKFCDKAKSGSNTGHMTKIPNSENSRWRTAAILKCFFFRYISAENHPISAKCGVRMQILVPITATSQNIKILQIQYGGRPPYWKSFFGISQLFIVRLTRNLARRSKITWDTGHMTKMQIFENSRWRTAAVLKMVYSLYLSR